MIGGFSGDGRESGPTPLPGLPQLAPPWRLRQAHPDHAPNLGSPAIDAGRSNDPGGTDQRGFTRFANNALDIGAVEFQGENTEFDFFLALDSDGDGSSNGVELAIGTDPLQADSEDPRNLRFASFGQNGDPRFTFGFSQQVEINLSLTRSIDLINFTRVSGLTDTVTDSSGTLGRTVTDLFPPRGGKAFYRLEAVRDN